jgi:hypothetical protein
MVDMSNRNLYGLMLIVTVAWLLIVVESYLFFAVIRPFGPPIHTHTPLPSSVVKILLTGALAGIWFAVMFALDALYARTRKTPT